MLLLLLLLLLKRLLALQTHLPKLLLTPMQQPPLLQRKLVSPLKLARVGAWSVHAPPPPPTPPPPPAGAEKESNQPPSTHRRFPNTSSPLESRGRQSA